MPFIRIFAALPALFGFTSLIVSISLAQPENLADVKPKTINLPSERPSGFPRNDVIWFTYYPPEHVTVGNRAPAVILLHHLGASHNKPMHKSARYLAARGVAAAVMTLPYHTVRALPGEMPLQRFVSNNPEQVHQAFSQSVADVRTVTNWLLKRPEVDSQKSGVVGVSLGAIILHLAMGQDERLRAGVAFLGGGDLLKINRKSLAGKIFLRRERHLLTEDEISKLRSVDPLTYAKNNQPRSVLMVQAARDAFIPVSTSKELWEALGRPPIQWMDTNHIALQFATKSAVRTSLAFLEAAWSGNETGMHNAPKVRVPTMKAGFLSGLDSSLTPALQWQALSLGKRKHMSLLNANLGLSGRGPFIGLAATVTPFIDIGFARRWRGGDVTPYASFHVVF